VAVGGGVGFVVGVVIGVWVSRILRMFVGGREKVGRWSVVMCWRTDLLRFC
jgi:multisubunit Na+/H+ antiporter MnhE subunit